METTAEKSLAELLTDVRKLVGEKHETVARDLKRKIEAEIKLAPDELRSLPSTGQDRPSLQSLLPEFLDSFVRGTAEYLAYGRKIEIAIRNPEVLHNRFPSLPEEMLNDWLEARALLALKVLEREIPFAQLDPRSYGHLEGSWLRRVKQLKAYYLWKSGVAGDAEEVFHQAGRSIRSWLLNRPAADLRGFEKARAYIAGNYLGKKGELDDSKPGTQKLIRAKAYRIWQTTGQTDEKVNWFRAKLYVTMFYESIIDAVFQKDEQKTATILKAFEFSKSPENRYLIINAFEAALAIEFLDKNGVVKKLLSNPQSFDFNLVPVDDWPERFRAPEISAGKFRYEGDNKQIVYEGEMEESERDALAAAVKTDAQRIALKHLFLQSRRKPLDEMIL